jgi:hypothetical protein
MFYMAMSEIHLLQSAGTRCRGDVVMNIEFGHTLDGREMDSAYAGNSRFFIDSIFRREGWLTGFLFRRGIQFHDHRTTRQY